MANVQNSGTPVFTIGNQVVQARALVDAQGYPDSTGKYISDKYVTPVSGFVGISTGFVKDGYLKVYIINKLEVYPDKTYSIEAETAWLYLKLITDVGPVNDKVKVYQRIYLENETSGTLPGNDGKGFTPGAGLLSNLELPQLKWLLLIALGIIILKK